MTTKPPRGYDFYIGQGDDLEDFNVVMQGADGTPTDLTGASIGFRLRHALSTTLAIDAAGSVGVDPTAGEATYEWGAGETDTLSGIYYAQFTATLSSGDVVHFPNARWLRVWAQPSLGGV